MAKLVLYVERELHVEAPPGDAVYAHACYARSRGASLLEVVRHEAMSVAPDGEHHFYARRLYRRRSEDNGRSWTTEPDEQRKDATRLAGTHRDPARIILDERNDVLITIFDTYEFDPAEPMFAIGNLMQRTRRVYYQLSRDGGRTWTDPRQVVATGCDYDATHWAPGISYRTHGGCPSGQHVFLPDGTLVLAFDVTHPEAPQGHGAPHDLGYYITTIYAQARWSDDGSALVWRFGDMISVGFPKALAGCCEAALAHLGGRRLFNTMRCQGDEARGIFSTRYTTLSEDGGLTWSRPTPLVYDDGQTVWTPASVHRFFPSSVTGKTYLLANILPGPVHAQTPRYPLAIAEFDTERLCVLRDTVQVIQDLPPGAPKERRYTNWGMYEERGSGDLILTMPEQPKFMDFSAMTRPEDFTADCIRFRVRVR
jgi:hypothetical protein